MTSKLRAPLIGVSQAAAETNCRAIVVPRLESPVGEWLVTTPERADCHGQRPHLHTHCHSLLTVM